jgi:peroxiredoxin
LRGVVRILGVVGVLLIPAVVVGEAVHSWLADAAVPPARETRDAYTPGFGKGDLAPDFTLPDAAGRRHSLSSLVHGDTMLCMLCGCEKCQTMQIYLGQMLRSLGPRAPHVISVSAAPPEQEAAWRRDTKLDQVLLYDSKANGSPVIEQYRGHPCPRVYRLDADRRVTWIAPSPARLATLDLLGEAIAHNLGYRLPPGRTSREVPGTEPAAQN